MMIVLDVLAAMAIELGSMMDRDRCPLLSLVVQRRHAQPSEVETDALDSHVHRGIRDR
jgi:hypothetical protein